MKKKYGLVAMLIIAVCVISTSVSGPTSSAAAPLSVHSVWSTQSLQIFDATIGQPFPVQSGNVAVSWTTAPLATGDTGFYDAIVYANSSRYEIRLVHFNWSTPDQINGLFEIYKNYALVGTFPGDVINLSGAPGTTFQFISSSSPWMLQSIDTNRIDF